MPETPSEPEWSGYAAAEAGRHAIALNQLRDADTALSSVEDAMSAAFKLEEGSRLVFSEGDRMYAADWRGDQWWITVSG